MKAIQPKKGRLCVNADKLVVGLAGMPGSGKSLVVNTARELGYDIVVMGDVIRQETLKRGLDLNPRMLEKSCFNYGKNKEITLLQNYVSLKS
jgi:dephospho-CoA kinase